MTWSDISSEKDSVVNSSSMDLLHAFLRLSNKLGRAVVSDSGAFGREVSVSIGSLAFRLGMAVLVNSFSGALFLPWGSLRM